MEKDKNNVNNTAPVLNPSDPKDRKEILKSAVNRTIIEYGEALKKLGDD